jgi:hypothetical protein
LQEEEEEIVVTFVTEQAQPSSKLGEAPQTLENYRYHHMENYLRETGMQKPSGQVGAALIFPQRELLVTH